MEAIVRAAHTERWPAKVVAVISNRADAGGLSFAIACDIPTVVISNKDFRDRGQFDAALQLEIDRFSPDVVVLAGFMRILTAPFVQHYAGRMLNIHPSLLPSFVGLETHLQALTMGVKVHGATVHFVTADLDHGPIIAQEFVTVLDDDTVESLKNRVLAIEHQMYPRAVRWFVEGRLKIKDGRVYKSDFVT